MGFPCLFWNPALLSGIRLCAPGGGNGRGALDSESSEVRRETSGSQSRPPGEGDPPGEMVVWWVYSGRTPRSRGGRPDGISTPSQDVHPSAVEGAWWLGWQAFESGGRKDPSLGDPHRTMRDSTHKHHRVSARTWEEKAAGNKLKVPFSNLSEQSLQNLKESMSKCLLYPRLRWRSLYVT